MSIELDDRVRRALDLAQELGSAAVSPAVLAILGARANGLASADVANAVVWVAVAIEVDSHGRGRVDTASPRPMPTIVVMDDDARFVVDSSAPNASGLVAGTFRRGTVRIAEGRFVLVEVEEDVSAREVQAELDVPMYADATLAPFV